MKRLKKTLLISREKVTVDTDEHRSIQIYNPYTGGYRRVCGNHGDRSGVLMSILYQHVEGLYSGGHISSGVLDWLYLNKN